MESENVKMREEFNVQRAKMKELFLQKEGKRYVYDYNFYDVAVFVILQHVCIEYRYTYTTDISCRGIETKVRRKYGFTKGEFETEKRIGRS